MVDDHGGNVLPLEKGQSGKGIGPQDYSEIFPGMISHDPYMKGRVQQRVETVAECDAPVLVVGETGTGKELVARAIHALGPRGRGPFVVLNCAAFPRDLLESELFGHEKGAFTGAFSRRMGKFELAAGGTIFLDEIGDLSQKAQAKVLRVCDRQPFFRLGGKEEINPDIRIVSATNRNLRKRTAAGKFREDLLYRLEVIMIELPPLRYRPGDIPLLAQYFLDMFRRKGSSLALGDAACQALLAHPWPGNVRELKSVMQRAANIYADEKELLPAHLSFLSGSCAVAFPDKDVSDRPEIPFGTLREIKGNAIRLALKLTGGNKTRAAKLLKISLRNLRSCT